MERDLVQAWHTAAFYRTERMPDLDDVLEKMRKAADPNYRKSIPDGRQAAAPLVERLKQRQAKLT